MIISFSGDPFLATRAARRKLSELRETVPEFTELAGELTPDRVASATAQAGLFGASGLFLDFDSAFSGQAGVKPRNALLKALGSLAPDSTVIVVDSSATPARQKQWQALGEHVHLPAPRFQALSRWVSRELQEAGVEYEAGVPELLIELFGEDLPALASEVVKLSLLGRQLRRTELAELTGKSEVTDAFAFMDAIVAGDAARALELVRLLQQQSEDAVRVLAALSWQFSLVSRCVGLLAAEPRANDSRVASALKLKPFVAGKVRRIAARLQEQQLLPVLEAVAEAELAAKGGRDGSWALEKAALELSARFA